MGISRAVTTAAHRSAGARVRPRPNRYLAFGGVLALLTLNLGALMLPIDYQVFGAWAYPGVFLITFIANAAIALPVPYVPIVIQVARSVELVPLVVATAALASVLGESVAYAVGRVQRDLFTDHRVYLRLQRFVGHPWRAAVALFILAAPLNPVFDVAGVAAGALGIPFRVFFWSVLLARLVRWGVIVWGATTLFR